VAFDSLKPCPEMREQTSEQLDVSLFRYWCLLKDSPL
jgi:hypothetical protein